MRSTDVLKHLLFVNTPLINNCSFFPQQLQHPAFAATQALHHCHRCRLPRQQMISENSGFESKWEIHAIELISAPSLQSPLQSFLFLLLWACLRRLARSQFSVLSILFTHWGRRALSDLLEWLTGETHPWALLLSVVQCVTKVRLFEVLLGAAGGAPRRWTSRPWVTASHGEQHRSTDDNENDQEADKEVWVICANKKIRIQSQTQTKTKWDSVCDF